MLLWELIESHGAREGGVVHKTFRILISQIDKRPYFTGWGTFAVDLSTVTFLGLLFTPCVLFSIKLSYGWYTDVCFGAQIRNNELIIRNSRQLTLPKMHDPCGGSDTEWTYQI